LRGAPRCAGRGGGEAVGCEKKEKMRMRVLGDEWLQMLLLRFDIFFVGFKMKKTQ
jgi:hypothetical protein